MYLTFFLLHFLSFALKVHSSNTLINSETMFILLISLSDESFWRLVFWFVLSLLFGLLIVLSGISVYLLSSMPFFHGVGFSQIFGDSCLFVLSFKFLVSLLYCSINSAYFWLLQGKSTTSIKASRNVGFVSFLVL